MNQEIKAPEFKWLVHVCEYVCEYDTHTTNDTEHLILC